MGILRGWFQRWDVSTSSQVNVFIAISTCVAQRIENHYKRKAQVIFPPVNWHSFKVSPEHDDYYLVVSAFAPYKRVDLAVEACNRTRRPLKIIGTGQDECRLRKKVGPSVELLGWQPDQVVREYFQRCRALIFPGEEDFGIVPLEAMACGKPVIAYGKGGVLDTVIPLTPKRGKQGSPSQSWHEKDNDLCPTGVFFYEQTPEGLIEALNSFEQNQDQFDPYKIRMHVEVFDQFHFKEKFKKCIEKYLKYDGGMSVC